MTFAWLIDQDVMAEAERSATGRVEDDAKGVFGPSDAPTVMVGLLQLRPGLIGATNVGGTTADGRTWMVYRFELYDDAGTVYYRGRLITEGVDDFACEAPLTFGSTNAGCTGVRYPGHPQLDRR